MIEKLCLGTAQFGLDYGIANKRGKVSKKEAFEILGYSYNRGINILDTASSYGSSETIIGEFLGTNKCDFRIISKLPPLSQFNIKDLAGILHNSLSKLKAENIYAYLVHKFEDFLKYKGLWNALEDLKKKSLVKKIGFSIYKPEELETIFESNVNFDIIQIPYSIFDRRFESYFGILKTKGIEVHARSIFLQGLVFLEPDNLPEGLSGARNCLERTRSLAKEQNISINALCLDFALANPCIDKAIIGVDSLEHLKKNIEGINLTGKMADIYGELGDLRIEDEDIILPYKWTRERHYA